MNQKKLLFQLAGPIAFIIIKLLHFNGLSAEGQAVMATTVWIAIWWITEAVELEVTALLPLVILPLSNGMKINDVASSYGSSYIFLFMGGFIIGLAIEKCMLHERIAFTIIKVIGSSPKMIILGFMVATAFLSMWISNTATAIMMLPIATSVVGNEAGSTHFSKNLMLSIAYSSSIGGMATLIGTPPNIIFAGIVKNSLAIDISFGKWMVLALPLSIALLILAWIYLTRKIPFKLRNIDFQIKSLPPITTAQKRVAVVFALVAFLWITQSFLISKIIPQAEDAIIAISGALILFIIPSGKEKETLMNWNTAKKLPWGILLIFGAGLAIAKGFSSTDLTTWIAGQFMGLSFVPLFVLILIIIASLNFLTEITSNTATASMMLPLLITLGHSLKIEPVPMLVGAVLACSCAFMLPVATPPNAVVFSTGKMKIADMVKSGLAMNLISIAIIFVFVWFVLPVLWN